MALHLSVGIEASCVVHGHMAVLRPHVSHPDELTKEDRSRDRAAERDRETERERECGRVGARIKEKGCYANLTNV